MGLVYAALDVDVKDELLAMEMRHHIEAKAAKLGQVWPMRIGQAPKALWLFRVLGGPVKRSQQALRRDDVEERQLVEVMGLSSKNTPTQAVLFGMHPTGVPYQWNMALTNDSIPFITDADMTILRDELVAIGTARGYTARNASRASDGTGSNLGAEAHDPTLIPELLALIPNPDEEYDHWVSVAYAIKATMGAPGWETFALWSAKAPKDEPKFTKRIWDGLKPDGSTGMGKLVFLARQACNGKLPDALAARVRDGVVRRGAERAGMPPVVEQVLVPPPVDAPPTSHRPGWEYIDFVLDPKTDMPVCNMANIDAWINNSDLWTDCFAFDAFNARPVILSRIPGDVDPRVPRFMEDSDLTTIQSWFQRYAWHKATKTDVTDAVALSARRNTFEPVQNYLAAQQWDGLARIDTWLFDYGGVRGSVDPRWLTYISQTGRKWLISAVARAMQPGCKVDHALILEGGQGKGKSSLLRALCPTPDWFSDSLPDFHTKDAMSHLKGKWIIEMAELTTVYKSGLEDMRRFLTRQVDDYRDHYGRLDTKQPRRCVFAGTTNRDDYVRDVEGERRFWIVRSDDPLRIKDIASVRDQLWAEAYAAYMSGEVWWLEGDMEDVARAIQLDRIETDPWVDVLEPLLAQHTEVTSGLVMSMLGLDVGSRTNIVGKRLANVLILLGWTHAGRAKIGGRKWVRR